MGSTATDAGFDLAGKGEPGMPVKAPVAALILYPETLLLLAFAT